MRLVYINPNSSTTMTDGIVGVARRVLPGAAIVGLTNATGPASIEGAEDGEASVPGLLSLLSATPADAIVIACFDDTGLNRARAVAPCPVIGIGQASYVMAGLLGQRFSVVTSVAEAVPVIQGNIAANGHGHTCASVRASGLPVLTIDEGSEATRAHLAAEILRARDEDGAEAVVLGCAGMSALAPDLSARTGMRLIDGVAASAHLARAVSGYAALE